MPIDEIRNSGNLLKIREVSNPCSWIKIWIILLSVLHTEDELKQEKLSALEWEVGACKEPWTKNKPKNPSTDGK